MLGDLERFVAEDLYPYRIPITIGLLLGVTAAIAFAYRMGWHMVAWRHKLVTGIAAVAVLAVTIPAGDYLLSPLWERSFLEEESPLATASTDSVSPDDDAAPAATPVDVSPTPAPAATPVDVSPTPAPADEATEPLVTHEGDFEGTDDFHFARGKALLIETAPDVYVLRFEEFSVRNGPDLFVYLSPSAEGNADGFIDLGSLKATDGAFNYDIPAGTDVSQYKSAIVWCKAFSVLFAVAPLARVP